MLPMRLVGLSEVEPERLREIFDEEVENWQRQLFWDYRPAVGLITRYMQSGSLAGHALELDGGRIAGYAYHLVDPPVGYVGNLYVRTSLVSAQNYQALLEKTLQALTSWGNVRRVECQVFSFNFEVAPLFLAYGFVPHPRHFLCLNLPAQRDSAPPHCSLEVNIIPWQRRFFLAAAEVIYDSYSQSPDYGLCLDYQSQQGCIRFLRNLVENPSCGIFAADTSYAALDSRGQLCGILVTSRISPDTGMIPQVSVRSGCQGRGLGSLLLWTYFREANKQRLKRVTLSVSHTNQRAHQLYLRLGFQNQKDFHAFILEPALLA